MNKECLGPRGPKIDLREPEKVRQGTHTLNPGLLEVAEFLCAFEAS